MIHTLITTGFIMVITLSLYGIFCSIKEVVQNHKNFINQLKSEKNE